MSERLLIEAGTVLTMDPDLGVLTPGQILVEDGKIGSLSLIALGLGPHRPVPIEEPPRPIPIPTDPPREPLLRPS